MSEGKLTWYEFGGPGDHYSFRAENDKVALAVCLLISPQGMMAFYHPEEMSVPSPMEITMSSNPEEMLKSIYPDFSEFVNENKLEILYSLSDCMVGEIKNRKELELELEMVIPERRDEFIENYKGKTRTSLMNLHPYINELINKLSKE